MTLTSIVTYVLIVTWHIGYGTAAISQEFDSKQECLDAKSAIEATWNSDHWKDAQAICVPK